MAAPSDSSESSVPIKAMGIEGCDCRKRVASSCTARFEGAQAVTLLVLDAPTAKSAVRVLCLATRSEEQKDGLAGFISEWKRAKRDRSTRSHVLSFRCPEGLAQELSVAAQCPSPFEPPRELRPSVRRLDDP